MSASREKKVRKTGEDTPVKKDKKRGRVDKLFIIVVAVVIVGILAALFVTGQGIPQRTATAMTVGDEKVSVAEYAFYYYLVRNQTISSYSITDSPTLDTQIFYSETTYGQYFREEAERVLKYNVQMAAEARKNGMTLTQENKDNIQKEMDGLAQTAKSQKISARQLLTQSYGKGANEAVLRRHLENEALAAQWEEHMTEELAPDTAACETYYQEHKNEEDRVVYRFLNMAWTTEEGAEESVVTAAKAEAKAKADAMNAEVTDEAAFYALAKKHASEAQLADLEKEDYTTAQARLGDISVTALKEWLADPARRAGDHTVIEGDSSYYVAMYVSRARDEYVAPSIRYIPVNVAAATADLTAEQALTNARAEAQKILDDWNAAGPTEDSFAALATAAQGGIVEDIAHGEILRSFEPWMFDAGRKAGDTTIIETQNDVLYVLYFSRWSDKPLWEIRVGKTVATESFDTYETGLSELYPETRNDANIKKAVTSR